MSGSETDMTDDSAGDQPRARGQRQHSLPRRRSYVNPLMLVLTLAFFFGPGAAALSGVRAQQIENRPPARFPSIHDGWKALPEVGTWATDHLAGRQQAVAANTEVARRLFGEQASDTASAKAGVSASDPRPRRLAVPGR